MQSLNTWQEEIRVQDEFQIEMLEKHVEEDIHDDI